MTEQHPAQQAVVMAIDAGGTYFKYGCVDAGGRILPGSKGSVPSGFQAEAEALLTAYAQCVFAMRLWLAKQGMASTSVAVSTPGPFDYAAYRSLMTHKFASIRGMDLRAALLKREALKVTDRLLFIHDAHAFTLGEFWVGAGKGCRSMLGITIGTGLGIGFVLDGRLAANPTGGPLHSIYGRPCLQGIAEDYVSARGIAGQYRKAVPNAGPVDARQVAALAAQEDGAALETYRLCGWALGETLRPLLSQYAVERVVLGGQVSRSYSLMEGGLRQSLGAAAALFVPAQHLDDSALLGAAAPLISGTPLDYDTYKGEMV